MAILLFLRRILLLLPTKPKPFIPIDQSNCCGFQVRINNIRDSQSPLQLSTLCLPRARSPCSRTASPGPQLLFAPRAVLTVPRALGCCSASAPPGSTLQANDLNYVSRMTGRRLSAAELPFFPLDAGRGDVRLSSTEPGRLAGFRV